ncbi:glycosyltransferase [Methylacidiphilum caldifontis]|uniref:Histidinol-phosphatase n=1 Tax=Methylacidiphilum caldifontis TaxID=2795386 RepID=A0A4Y8PGQ9_9BACT|nr:glycosyltransferase [Methylacidiphilum caldifontis]QSR89577.1 glycosyltransferase [Methylacidiphilum caldifontis]TFE71142.1 histidinol-phosphatase [Methylacidiphilum caldifontis]
MESWSKVDLHVHSSYSDRPSEWVLRRIGFPQSCTPPQELYEKLQSKGMRWKTITDHNRIEGCLELMEKYQDVFLGVELSTFFPDGCEIHLLIWHFDELDFKTLKELSLNVFELSRYLVEKNIPHAVAHPLKSLNSKLTTDHFEKMILLFKGFEVCNGALEPLSQKILSLCLGALTPKHIEDFEQRQGMASMVSRPHEKIFVGGSNDHGGLSVASAWTEAKAGDGIEGFFDSLFRGEGRVQGEMGDPLKVSTGFYNTFFKFALGRLKQKAPLTAELVGKIAERFIKGQNPTAFSFAERVGHLAEAIRTGQAFNYVGLTEGSTLTKQFIGFLTDSKTKQMLDAIVNSTEKPIIRSFRIASKIVNELSYRLFLQFVSRLEKGDYLDAFQSLSGFLPLGIAVMPYLWAFFEQSVNKPFLRKLALRYMGCLPKELSEIKVAWFTDTIDDVNGVARTIQAMAKTAYKQDAYLKLVISRSQLKELDIPVKNFEPVGEFEIPEYKLQKLSFPPFLEIMDYVKKEDFSHLVISTPGPVGLCALLIGKILKIPMMGIYHTDFPQYARFLSDDSWMETLAWRYMEWFYGQLNKILVNSEYYKHCWIQRGISPEKLALFPRGIDVDMFSPSYFDPSFWKKYGLDSPVLLYVGRISKEKELAFLAELSHYLWAKGKRFSVAFVGEGPFREELQKLVPEAIFTGILTGLELSKAYASSFLFVFPSTTDTFGNVVLEAMASGVPAIVSDVGGPSELVSQLGVGRICKTKDIKEWAETISFYLDHPLSWESRIEMAEKIRKERSWNRAFQNFWQMFKIKED